MYNDVMMMMTDNGNHRLRIIHCQGVTRPERRRRRAGCAPLTMTPLDIDINQRNGNQMRTKCSR